MRLPFTLLSIALGFAASFACTQENKQHCGNLDGDRTCETRDFRYCNTCSGDNDGCQDAEPLPSCRFDPVGTEADTNASASSSGGPNPGSSSSGTPSTTGEATGTTVAAEDSSTAAVDTTAGEQLCGNGVIDDGEDCDGEELGDNMCAAGGELSCAVDCTLDMSACATPPECPDDTLDNGEQCDGLEFGDQTCETFSNQYGGGALTCNANCTISTESCCVADYQNCKVNPCCAGSTCNFLDACIPDA
jgi:hypothetical protein